MPAINKILFALDAGEIDVAEAARLMRENRKQHQRWFDWLLERIAA